MFKKSKALLGTACLLAALVPAAAQAQGLASAASSQVAVGASQFDGISAFYAWRQNAPFWLGNGTTPAVTQLLAILKRAPIEGMTDGAQLAAEAEAAIASAQGDPAKTLYADRLLSTAWARYVQMIRAPVRGMEIGMPYFAPRPVRADDVMYEAARSAASLDQYLKATSDVNPIYAKLRDAAVAQFGTGASDPRVAASLERSKIFPATGRFVMVDSASQRLFIVENGEIKDSMKIVVGMVVDKNTGKATPELHTPMIVSMIYYATFNPYWHVPDHLVRNIAKSVVAVGPKALNGNRYQVVNAFSDDATVVDPTTVDWKSVAAGTKKILLRQLPGPNNSMGVLKFQFPNASGIYLHDTPHKEYFLKADRAMSNGCVRLEDARRLGRWLLGRDPVAPSKEPEQHVQLPQGVPIYVTYLTARMDGEKIAFMKDLYQRDSIGTSRVAAAEPAPGAASAGQPR